MNKEIFCTFCGKSQDEVVKLIAGPSGVYICDSCVLECQDMIKSYAKKPAESAIKELPAPQEIKAELDNYIIGQDDAKRVLSVAVYNHYKRIKYNSQLTPQKGMGKQEPDTVELDKSNILILGPTGSGKTLLAKTLARILDVPFAVADATTLTEAGYVGEDVENILLKLIQNADFDVSKAERGIIYVDETDKIARKSENMSITRDVSGEGVQQALLKIMEGTIASVPPQGGRKHPQQECIPINTTNILFIFGGAFVGLEKIIDKRNSVASLGFSGNVTSTKDIDLTKVLKEIQPQDLTKFGLIPEFVGRIPVVVSLEPLDESALSKILTEPRNALTKQFKKMLELDNVDLEFEDDAVKAIASKAIALKTGARGLRSILEEAMLDIMYKVPSDKSIEKILITAATINEKKAPEILYRKPIVKLA